MAVFQFDPVPEPWARVIGVLVMGIALIYHSLMRSPHPPLSRMTVYAPVFIFAAFAAFVGLGLSKPALILFGTVDLGFAVWTYLALRGDARASAVFAPPRSIQRRHRAAQVLDL